MPRAPRSPMRCGTSRSAGRCSSTPATTVYQGMIIGEHSRGNDLDVNVLKGKQLTNIRAAGKDEAVRLTPPRRMTPRAGDRLYRGGRAGRGDAEVDPPAQALPQSRGPQARQEAGRRRRPRRIEDDPLKSRDATFTDRLETAAKARQAQLARARAKDPTKDPEFAARQEARAAAAYAREEREIGARRSPSSPSARRKRAERDARKAEQVGACEAERAGRVHAPADGQRRRAEGRARRPLRRPQGAQEVATLPIQRLPVSEARWLISM